MNPMFKPIKLTHENFSNYPSELMEMDGNGPIMRPKMYVSRNDLRHLKDILRVISIKLATGKVAQEDVGMLSDISKMMQTCLNQS